MWSSVKYMEKCACPRAVTVAPLVLSGRRRRQGSLLVRGCTAASRRQLRTRGGVCSAGGAGGGPEYGGKGRRDRAAKARYVRPSLTQRCAWMQGAPRNEGLEGAIRVVCDPRGVDTVRGCQDT